MGNIYIGDINGKARKAEKIYIGDINGIARKVQKIYIGDANGIARQVYSAFEPPTLQSISGYNGSWNGRVTPNPDGTWSGEFATYPGVWNLNGNSYRATSVYAAITLTSNFMRNMISNGYRHITMHADYSGSVLTANKMGHELRIGPWNSPIYDEDTVHERGSATTISFSKTHTADLTTISDTDTNFYTRIYRAQDPYEDYLYLWPNADTYTLTLTLTFSA